MQHVAINKLQPEFRASTKTSPAIRDEVRQLIAQASAGVSVEVITGFSEVKPMPPRK